MCQAVVYLHEQKPVIVHGDLKTSNATVELSSVKDRPGPSGHFRQKVTDTCEAYCPEFSGSGSLWDSAQELREFGPFAKLLDFGLSRTVTRNEARNTGKYNTNNI